MNVVRHQAIRVQRATRQREQAIQVKKIKAAIVSLKEARLSIVPSVPDVHRNAGKRDASAPGHDELNGAADETLTETVVCP